MINDELMKNIRDRFDHVDECPYQGKRIFFENAGGALTLKSVTDKSREMAAVPDNQGRDNVASAELSSIIDQAKSDALTFFGASDGQVFVGESGTELIFRLISTAIAGAGRGCDVLGSTLEHPATRSACERWAGVLGANYNQVIHNNDTGNVTADDYRPHITENTQVATILHTSPVTGMDVDIKSIAKAIREIAPDCYIIVDGIQHAAHGAMDIDGYDIDGYVISPYKAFSRHGYGMAWVSDRLTALPHNQIIGGPTENWELGTRDTGSYATFSEVVNYFNWLGGHFSNSAGLRERLVAAGKAVLAHEKDLTDLMIMGDDGHKGLGSYENVHIIGGHDNPARRGLVSFWVDGKDSVDLVAALNAKAVRTHTRKNDHYSGNILIPLNQKNCVRVSLCHYNTADEVRTFLNAMSEILA